MFLKGLFLKDVRCSLFWSPATFPSEWALLWTSASQMSQHVDDEGEPAVQSVQNDWGSCRDKVVHTYMHIRAIWSAKMLPQDCCRRTQEICCKKKCQTLFLQWPEKFCCLLCCATHNQMFSDLFLTYKPTHQASEIFSEMLPKRRKHVSTSFPLFLLLLCDSRQTVKKSISCLHTPTFSPSTCELM